MKIIEQWVEQNIYPQVSPKVKWGFWIAVMVGAAFLAASYDYWFLTNIK